MVGLRDATVTSREVMVGTSTEQVVSGTADEMMQEHILSDVFDTPVRVHTIDGQRTAIYVR